MAKREQPEQQERKAHKDYFDRGAARELGVQFKDAWPEFDDAAFVRTASRGLGKLEFNDRIKQFSDALAQTLPENRKRALSILKKSLPPPLPDCESVTDGFLQWPLGQFIADYGTNDFAAAMSAMEALTQRLTSEYAVRPFMEQHQDRTIARLKSLTNHRNAHVRRWCSEGTRSRLPWGRKLHALVEDPSPVWPILEDLKDDPELYVRKSVANNINDIAKDNPDDVIRQLKRWSKNSNPDRDWVIRHGLRTLIKDGNADALGLVGYGKPKSVNASLTISPKSITVGGQVNLELQLTTTSTKAQELMVDYVVHYVRSGGKHSGKVFKWATATLPARGEIALAKKHSMKVTTIRALYPGRHRIEVQVNGVCIAESAFTLKA